jgi:hypothetical protein
MYALSGMMFLDERDSWAFHKTGQFCFFAPDFVCGLRPAFPRREGAKQGGRV